MNYKKIIKNRQTRTKLLKVFSWVPDKTMIKIQYRIKTGRKLNINNPERYTEKLQYYKINYRNNAMPKCVDKYDVRDYVIKKGYGGILNKLYEVFDDPDKIDFSELPSKFVIKDTVGSGSNSVLVVDKHKPDYDEEKIKTIIQSWLKIKPTKSISREWPYDNIMHRVIAEKYLEQKNGDLDDYKFFCFNGKVKYFYKRSGYAKSHDDGVISFYDKKGRWLKGVGLDYCKTSSKKQPLCKELNEMMRIAETLSSDFPHVRVDFYNIDGKIVFGELTFFNASGYMIFTPDEFDYEIGESFQIGGKSGL